MASRRKKPAISVDQPREWLRRYLEGESPPQIAKNDGYDPRTVRKHIELEQQRRESRDARSMVLRQALELHYIDLISVVKQVDSRVAVGAVAKGADRNDRMWRALREHLPRSPLWKLLDKWDRLLAQRTQAGDQAAVRFQDSELGNAPIGVSVAGDVVGMHKDGLVKLVVHRLMRTSLALGEPPDPEPVLSENADDGLVNLVCASVTCATVPKTDVSKVKKFLSDLQGNIAEWPEVNAMKRVLSDLTKVTPTLQEELATIILRRVVPGRCKYCPF